MTWVKNSVVSHYMEPVSIPGCTGIEYRPLCGAAAPDGEQLWYAVRGSMATCKVCQKLEHALQGTGKGRMTADR